MMAGVITPLSMVAVTVITVASAVSESYWIRKETGLRSATRLDSKLKKGILFAGLKRQWRASVV